ncbi:hypothetical protein MKX03_014001 [Papaver bracteatum]|nr:hypothetical protein MKX03_014001 [Papaver bracteatum]
MTLTKRYILRLFMSLKYISANVIDRKRGQIVVSASTAEKSMKQAMESSCNVKAAEAVGEVLAMRLKVGGLDQGGEGNGIHVNVNKEVEKKGFKNRTKILALVDALKNHGVKLVLDDDDGKDDGDTSSPTQF